MVSPVFLNQQSKRMWLQEVCNTYGDFKVTKSFRNKEKDHVFLKHKSVLDCCEFFYPRMAHGGIMIFDYYGFLSCPGAKEAVDTYFMDKPETPIYLPTGQVIVMRLFSEK